MRFYGFTLRAKMKAVIFVEPGRIVLGNPSNITFAGSLGRSIQTKMADSFVAGLLPVLLNIRSMGATTLEAISHALNQRGIQSLRGGQWRASSVANLLARAHKLEPLRPFL